MDFPKMLYKHGGPHDVHGGKFDHIIVNDEAEQDAALANGWHPTTPDAKEAHEAAKVAEWNFRLAAASAAVKTAANAEPTRAELEQKATELGITFAPNIGDKKLAERIEEALKG